MNLVAQICSNCAYSCFKETCPRKDWCSDSIMPLPAFGKDNECPLLQFDVKKPRNTDYRLTIADTWKVCAKCKHSTKKDGYINIAECFEKHCMDCTCNHIRDNLEEMMAERFS